MRTIGRMRTRSLEVAAGVELAVDTWEPATRGSSGRAFLLVHGLASNARLWDGVAAALVELGHVVHAVDLRGHGRSSKPAGPYDVPTVADDLAALIAILGMDRPIAAGQSWGGNVVLELAARHPDATRGLVLVDGGWIELRRQFPDWEACRTALAPPPLVGRPAAEVEGYLRSNHPDWPEAGIRGALANFDVRADETIAPWLTFDRHMAVLRGLWDHCPSERYADVTVPVQLVPVEHGDPAWQARVRAAIDAALTVLPVARARWFIGDHDIHAQHPDEVAGLMHQMTVDGFVA
jgi:pimeloyl-ACP methyl ester carboxylesterase